MIATAGLRPWLRGVALLTALLAALGLALGLAEGPAGASSGGNIVAQSRGHLLVLSDLPAGWTAQGSVTNSTNGGTFPGAKQLAQCLGVSQAIINLNEPQASSPSFVNKGQTLYAQDQFGIYPSVSVARQEFASFSNAKTPGCVNALMAPGGALRTQMASSFGEGAKMGAVTVTALGTARVGPHAAGFRMAFPVTTQGVTLATTFDFAVIVRGKLSNMFVFSSVGASGFPASLEKHLVSLGYGRT
jgi:hypothetical protein